MAWEEEETYLTPGEVAAMFRVNPKTVTRWVKEGSLPPDAVVKTPGGHRRFKLSVMKIIQKHGADAVKGGRG